jgi:hypothetical protein
MLLDPDFNKEMAVHNNRYIN